MVVEILVPLAFGMSIWAAAAAAKGEIAARARAKRRARYVKCKYGKLATPVTTPAGRKRKCKLKPKYR